MAKRYKVLLVVTTISVLLLAWYQYHRYKSWWSFPNYDDGLPTGEVGDKVIVMAKLAMEDTSWVAENLPDWQRAIYTVDDPNAPLHTPANKGKESLAYLTYVIEHYSSLPSTVVFLHSHRSGYPRAYHTDIWNWDNVLSVKSLRLRYVQESGYVNLRCNLKPGCVPKNYSPNEHVTKELWVEIFGSGLNATAGEAPDHVGQTCCAQFAVSRTQIWARPLEHYMSYRQWILNTELDDEKSGRVMEYLWHIIFGKDALNCPDERTCYCNVYGRCN